MMAMALHAWLRALDAVGGLASVAQRILAPREETPESRDPLSDSLASAGPTGQLGQLEARLAGVVVAALKEAFDRDRARLDLERHHLDGERERADRALRLEQARQAGDRALTQLRMIAVVSLAVWMASAVLMAAVIDGSEPTTKGLLAAGWSGLVGAVACAFVAHGRVLAWLAQVDERPAGPPAGGPTAVAPWLLVAGLAITAASFVVAM